MPEIKLAHEPYREIYLDFWVSVPRWVLSNLNRKREADLGLQNCCTTIMHDYRTSTLLEKIKSIRDENTSKRLMTDRIMAAVRSTDELRLVLLD